MTTLWQDVRYGVRMLVRNPSFTAVVVVILAIGIGATAGVFTVVNAVLLRPIPLKDAHRLVMLWETHRKMGHDLVTVSPADYVDWKSQSTAFDQMAIMQGWNYTLLGAEQTTRLRGTKVSAEFFSTVGVDPVLGRTFTPEEAREGGPPAVIVGYGLWQRLYGKDHGLIGSTVTVSGGFGGPIQCTVIGIAPAGFSFPGESELWLPYPTDTIKATVRGGWSANVVARLRSGVTRAQAQAEMNVIAERLAQAYPESNRESGVRITSLHEHLVRNARPLLYMFQAAVLLVLIVAVVNVANLLLGRSAFRSREMALRAALGAGRWRMARQLLTENLLLAVAGGTLGLLVTYLAVRGLGNVVAKFVPRAEESRMDRTVLLFTLLVSVGSGLVFGLTPMLRVAKTDLNECLKGRSPARGFGASGRGRMRHSLVIVEIALSLVLLAGAGLFLKSFILLGRVQLGFDPRHVLTVELDEAAKPLGPELLQRLSSLPGVQAAGAVRDLPIGNPSYIDEARVEGELPKTAGEQRLLYYNSVTPDYFRAMGMALVKGRGITEQDTETSPPVVVVNETFVKRLLGSADPIGKRLTKGRQPTIVGVVSDVKYGGLGEKTQPHAYCSCRQERTLPVRYLVLRTASDPLRWASSVREVIQSAEKDRPNLSLQTMEQRIDNSLLPHRFQAALVSVFSAIGLVLATVGIYGVVSYSVAQRTYEFGIRMALGARSGTVLRAVLRQGLKLTGIGLLLGLAGALAATRVIRSFLYDVSPTDPLTFACVALLLVGAALLACYIPARRAARIDPMVALRYE